MNLICKNVYLSIHKISIIWYIERNYTYLRSWCNHCHFTFSFGQLKVKQAKGDVLPIELLGVKYSRLLIILHIVNYHERFEIVAKRLKNASRSANKD